MGYSSESVAILLNPYQGLKLVPKQFNKAFCKRRNSS